MQVEVSFLIILLQIQGKLVNASINNLNIAESKKKKQANIFNKLSQAFNTFINLTLCTGLILIDYQKIY